MIILNEEQHRQLAVLEPAPVRAIDSVTQRQYFLVRAEWYERIKSLQVDDLPSPALMNEIMAEDDLLDPYLDSYQKHGTAP